MSKELSSAYLRKLVDLASDTNEISMEALKKIILAGIADGRLTEEAGWAWTRLSTHALRCGHPERAREILCMALGIYGNLPSIKISTVDLCAVSNTRDFGLVFDALAKLDELSVGRVLKRLERKKKSPFLEEEADWKLARFEYLMAKRKVLLNQALLRANPSNVELWMERIEFFQGQTEIYLEALATIDPKKALSYQGKQLSDLWIAFATANPPEEKNKIFEKAVTDYVFGSQEETVAVWIAYAKVAPTPMAALEILCRGIGSSACPKSLLLWEAIIDEEKKLGFPSRIRAAYERTIELRIATPATIFSYISLLEEGKEFSTIEPDSQNPTEISAKTQNLVKEKSAEIYCIYERAIASFGFPAAFDLWSGYLMKFENDLGQTPSWRMVERGRELYEQALRGAPTSKMLWIAYARFEERYGQPRAALVVLRRGATILTTVISKESTDSKEYHDDACDLWTVLLAKTRTLSGLLAMRQVYEEAIKVLPDSNARGLCLTYAALEASLGESERARSVFAYGARLADPRLVGSYWSTWESFERTHGTPDTYREFLRIKRAVQAQFSISDVKFVPSSSIGELVAEEQHPFSRLSL